MNFKCTNKKEFTNGIVYGLKTADGYPIETTDTFLPYYTKFATGIHSNTLKDDYVADRHSRWMIGVSTQSGCICKCKFCATSVLKKFRNLSSLEIVSQVLFIIKNNPGYNPLQSKEFKINYTRMGEPFLNIKNIKNAIKVISEIYPNVHHYVSTIGIKDSDFSWIKDNITLQISLHSLDESRRNILIPYKNKMTIEELGQVRTGSKLKTTVNLTLVDEKDWDVHLLRKWFDPEFFFIKLSPINVNTISDKNELGAGIILGRNLV